jgi:hypothetical protein
MFLLILVHEVKNVGLTDMERGEGDGLAGN